MEQQDVNVVIIITLMLIVGVMGMVSALLILILERVQMIGILKTLGMRSGSIRGIFLYRAAYILLLTEFSSALRWASAWVLYNNKTASSKLDKESYYMDTVPAYFDAYSLIGINALTLVFCLLTLILLTLLATRITPLQAIRTD